MAEPPGHRHAAADHRDHRPRAHALDDRRLDLLLGVVAVAGRLAQRLVGVGVADQALPGPGERVGGRLVAGEDEGEQLVADFFVVHRLALLGPRLQEQREDVAALLEVLVGAAGAAITA